ncbi:hypothetical protein OC844_001884 [Tilletia horrida]|nr:hypothetical protein OC844_001884 [Tilletia horrida]
MPVSDFDLAIFCLSSASPICASEVLRPDIISLATLPDPNFLKLAHSQLLIGSIPLAALTGAPSIVLRRLTETRCDKNRRLSRATIAVHDVMRFKDRLHRKSTRKGRQTSAAVSVIEVYINSRPARLHSAFDSSSVDDLDLPPKWIAEAQRSATSFKRHGSSRLALWSQAPIRKGSQLAKSALRSAFASAGGRHSQKSWTRIATTGGAEIKLCSHASEVSSYLHEPITSFTLVVYHPRALLTAKRPGETRRGSLDAVFHFVVTGSPVRTHRTRSLTELDPLPLPSPAHPSSRQMPKVERRQSRLGAALKMPANAAAAVTLPRPPSFDSVVSKFKGATSRLSQQRLSISRSLSMRRSATATAAGTSSFGAGLAAEVGFVRESGRSVSSARDLLLPRRMSASPPSATGGPRSYRPSTSSSSPSSRIRSLTEEGGAYDDELDGVVEAQLQSVLEGKGDAFLHGFGGGSGSRSGSGFWTPPPMGSLGRSTAQMLNLNLNLGLGFETGAAAPRQPTLSPSPSASATGLLTPPEPERSHSMSLSSRRPSTSASMSSMRGGGGGGADTMSIVSAGVPRKPVPRSRSIQDLVQREDQRRRSMQAVVVHTGTGADSGRASLIEEAAAHFASVRRPHTAHVERPPLPPRRRS